ncbi:MAG: hypothetical protein FD138_1915 [Planctomycetota bacterium]|nr:MAG: hypothetical protein FD138_1915 [Planctomycetota bacterium]
MKLDGGATAPGLVFEVHNVPNTVQGTSYISFTDKDPLPNGKVVIASPKTKLLLKRKTDQVLVTVGHVELPDAPPGALTVVPINIVIRRRAEANSVNRVEVPVDAKGTVPLPKWRKEADQAPEIFEEIFDRKNARAVVEIYVAAALAGRIEHAASLAQSTPAERNQIESLSRQLNVKRLAMKSVYVNDPAKPTTALATSEAVKLTKQQPNGQRDGVLVLTLTMTNDGWSVTDIDFESEESAEVELRRFLDAHRNAVGLPPLKANVLPGTDSGSRIAPQATGKQLGTVLGKPIRDFHLNQNTSTDDNLKRLLFRPLMESYCQKQGLDRADELNAKIKDERNRRIASFFVLPAELNRHLFEKHGGRVILSPFGAVPFDGLKKWLEEREQAGDFEITDPELKAAYRELWMQELAGAQFASPDQIKEAFDPALTDRFIETFVKREGMVDRGPEQLPVDEIARLIDSIKNRTNPATAAKRLRTITTLDFGDGVDRESRQAWLEWWDREKSNVENAAAGVREFTVADRISDPVGNPIAGATVRVHVPCKSSPTGHYQLAHTISDRNGNYVLQFGIPPFATKEELTWQATFTALNPPRFVADADYSKFVKTLHRKLPERDGNGPKYEEDTIFVGLPAAMKFMLRPAVKPRGSAETDASPKTEQPVPPKPQDKLPDEKASDSQSEAQSANGQTKFAIGQISYSLPFRFPSVESILRHLPEGKARPKNERIECELVKYQVSDARHYPLVGPAQLVQAQFKSTLTSEAGREVVFSDSSHLLTGKKHSKGWQH